MPTSDVGTLTAALTPIFTAPSDPAQMSQVATNIANAINSYVIAVVAKITGTTVVTTAVTTVVAPGIPVSTLAPDFSTPTGSTVAPGVGTGAGSGEGEISTGGLIPPPSESAALSNLLTPIFTAPSDPALMSQVAQNIATAIDTYLAGVILKITGTTVVETEVDTIVAPGIAVVAAGLPPNFAPGPGSTTSPGVGSGDGSGVGVIAPGNLIISIPTPLLSTLTDLLTPIYTASSDPALLAQVAVDIAKAIDDYVVDVVGQIAGTTTVTTTVTTTIESGIVVLAGTPPAPGFTLSGGTGAGAGTGTGVIAAGDLITN